MLKKKMNTLFEKLWDSHVIEQLDEESYLLAVDRIYLHDLCGTFAFQMMKENKKDIFRRENVYATPDHTLPSRKDQRKDACEISRLIMPKFREGCKRYGITLFDTGDSHQGIVHIIGPETGLSLPGMTIVCGDSHTCTHGAVGALAMGVGTSEVYHALATTCVIAKKPKTLKIEIKGRRKEDISAMDIILFIISQVGIDFGVGYAVEYTGEVVRHMNIDERCTLCNLTIELGAEYGMVSPDKTTLEYLRTREYAPSGDNWDAMKEYCGQIATTSESIFDREITFDISGISRQISWGVDPSQTVAVDGRVPEIVKGSSIAEKQSYEKAYAYMDLRAGQAMSEISVDYVFIGSCSNGRITYLKQIAELVRGKKVAEGVTAWIVPGSAQVKKTAEQMGIAEIFTKAGFSWGEPSCSLCVGSNGEMIPPGKRCV